MCGMNTCDGSTCASCTFPQNEVLKGLDIKQLQVLDQVRKEQVFEAGSIIKKAYSPSGGILCIGKGIVAVSSPEDKQTIMDIYTKGEYIILGDFFGEERLHLDLVALTNVKICTIPIKHMDEMLHSNIHFTRKLIKQTSKKYTDSIIFNNMKSKLPMEQRLAYVIAFVARKVGMEDDNMLSVYFKRKTWAALSNMNVANVIRTFTKLDKQGLIYLDGKKLYLPELKKLDDYVEEYLID